MTSTSPTPRIPASRLWLSRALIADPRFGPLPGLLLLLTVVTGVVDAISILALGRVFVANMTGNVVFAGFAIAGAPGFSLSASLFALAGFLVGATAGGAMITRAGQDRGALLRAGALAEFSLAAVALAVATLSGAPGVSHSTVSISTVSISTVSISTVSISTVSITAGAFGPAVTDALAAVLALAMGIQNAVARKLAVPDMTTTVLTMTLTGLGADLRTVLRGGEGHAAAKATLARRLLSIATMLAGALSGAALTLYTSPVAALALALSLLGVAASGAVAAASHSAPWRTPPPQSR